ncbi:atrophin-1-like, partial [Phymastichus coffea]|uniref:atrophin-1-like n=1 Tax=Phymastichus coffea TaxID=108790 RepID=UPI00273AEA16
MTYGSGFGPVAGGPGAGPGGGGTASPGGGVDDPTTYPPDSPYFPFGSRAAQQSGPAVANTTPTGNGPRMSGAGANTKKKKDPNLEAADGEVVTSQHW